MTMRQDPFDQSETGQDDESESQRKRQCLRNLEDLHRRLEEAEEEVWSILSAAEQEEYGQCGLDIIDTLDDVHDMVSDSTTEIADLIDE
jgi:F0F1-type ATP synthase membrane subunit b/b'